MYYITAATVSHIHLDHIPHDVVLGKSVFADVPRLETPQQVDSYLLHRQVLSPVALQLRSINTAQTGRRKGGGGGDTQENDKIHSAEKAKPTVPRFFHCTLQR